MVWSVADDVELYRHVFPEEVISQQEGFLNDLVIDPSSRGRFVFFSDNGNGPITGAQVKCTFVLPKFTWMHVITSELI